MRDKFTVILFSLCSYLNVAADGAEPGIRPVYEKTDAGIYRVSLVQSDNRRFTPAESSIEVNGQRIDTPYSKAERMGNTVRAIAVADSPGGSQFIVEDEYAPRDGRIRLKRKVTVARAGKSDSCFNSVFGFVTDGQKGSTIADNEFFVPGVWYITNFRPEGNLQRQIPQPGDTYFMYRADRITLPLVMFRDPADSSTLSITHVGCDPQTVVADARGERINGEYRYGSVGAMRDGGHVLTCFVYPGSEYSRRSGSGVRSHPVENGFSHEYELEIDICRTPDYPSALRRTWERAFAIYDPPVFEVPQQTAYEGLMQTLHTYYVPSTEMGGRRDAPGWPFQVDLETFEVMGIDYQMGFVGMQIATGYYLFREGVENGDTLTRRKGAAVLDFWAGNCLTELGMPRIWYDPGLDGKQGRWRKANNLRSATGGMESLLAGWCFAKKNSIDTPSWISACRRFGDWLCENQNPDGSFYFAYDHNRIENGRHPLMIETRDDRKQGPMDDKYLTVCTIRYLVELHIATGDERFRAAAMKAGEFCHENIHKKYAYKSCVVDNPQTIDSESGQLALTAFLSLYDLTGDRKWLDAAQQAATYTETWVFCYDIPVERDRTGYTVFPRERSVVGQHLIAVGHSAADLGFAWLPFAYYRLYLETEKKHYLHVARIAAHNTKQTMNWDGSLYPGQPRGLQLEAYRIMIPRRARGVMHTLNWNYAAHLDPMFRFKDAFGTPDIEQAEKMSRQQKRQSAQRYSRVQSADYGQWADKKQTEKTNNP